MKTSSYLFKVVFFLALVYLQSCQKVLDRVFDPANGAQSKCAITKITRTSDDVGIITYNAAGNPGLFSESIGGYIF